MLQLKNINARILTNINLHIYKNEFVLVTGDNGAGKTTLFNIISGAILPTSGCIIVDGCDVTKMPQHKRASLISNVLQDPRVGTVGNMTIRENMNIAFTRGKKKSIFAMSNSRKRDEIYAEKLALLNMNLEKRLDDYVGNLSGGQRQAISIIMSTLNDSKILLFDEITAALDQKTSEKILQIAKNTAKYEGKTCLMITHDSSHIKQLGDRLFVLQNGKLQDKKEK